MSFGRGGIVCKSLETEAQYQKFNKRPSGLALATTFLTRSAGQVFFLEAQGYKVRGQTLLNKTMRAQ
jgi:hypothetical protein